MDAVEVLHTGHDGSGSRSGGGPAHDSVVGAVAERSQSSCSTGAIFVRHHRIAARLEVQEAVDVLHVREVELGQLFQRQLAQLRRNLNRQHQ